jgi:outer membrane protein
MPGSRPNESPLHDAGSGRSVAKAHLKGYNAARSAVAGTRRISFEFKSYGHGEQMETISRYCALVLFALIATAASAQSTKIGYVNVVRIENESALAKQSMDLLRKEFAPREQQLAEMQKQGNALQADLEKNAATMPLGERQAKEKRITAMLQQYQQMQRSMAEDFEVRKRESFGGFLSEVNGIIKNIAEAGKYDLIVQQAVYNSTALDITDEVMKELAKRAAAAGK